MQTEYVNAVRLLLQVLPSVFESGQLALKGGTAINLYLDDMPRLSVDIDAVFLPIGITRDEALLAINDEVSKIAQTSEGMGLRVHRAIAEDVNESQLLITNGSTQVKIEINTVFRGTVLEPKLRSLNPMSSEIFAIDVSAMLLDPAEIIDELVQVREALRRDIITGFSEASRSFIKGFFSGTPQWDLIPFNITSERDRVNLIYI